jgi:membrane protease YdiL (CAAX protease family)
VNNRPSHLVSLIIIFEGALLPLAWGLSWLLDLPLELSPGVGVIGLAILATAPMCWLLERARSADLPAIRELFEWVDGNLVPVFKAASTWQLALVAILAGLGEELLFRGVMQQGLQVWLGPWTGLLLTSLVFGMVHWVSRAYLVFASLMGLYLGLLYWISGNLLLPIIVHGLYDFVALRMLLAPGPATRGNT